MQQSPSGAFYEAFFSDAQTISKELDLVVLHKDFGGEALQVPMLLIPAKPQVLQRFSQYLQEQGFQVFVAEPRLGIQPPTASLSLETLANQVRVYDLEIDGSATDDPCNREKLERSVIGRKAS